MFISFLLFSFFRIHCWLSDSPVQDAVNVSRANARRSVQARAFALHVFCLQTLRHHNKNMSIIGMRDTCGLNYSKIQNILIFLFV